VACEGKEEKIPNRRTSQKVVEERGKQSSTGRQKKKNRIEIRDKEKEARLEAGDHTMKQAEEIFP